MLACLANCSQTEDLKKVEMSLVSDSQEQENLKIIAAINENLDSTIQAISEGNDTKDGFSGNFRIRKFQMDIYNILLSNPSKLNLLDILKSSKDLIQKEIRESYSLIFDLQISISDALASLEEKAVNPDFEFQVKEEIQKIIELRSDVINKSSEISGQDRNQEYLLKMDIVYLEGILLLLSKL